MIFKAIQQAPFVALFAYLWWQNRKDLKAEIKYLEERSKEKDKRIEQLVNTLDRFNLTLELIKERLR